MSESFPEDLRKPQAEVKPEAAATLSLEYRGGRPVILMREGNADRAFQLGLVVK